MQSSILLLAIAALVAARTDLSGCVSSETVAYGGGSLIWYVPGSGEICAFVDCGGGAGAPVTTNPGCPLYSGTATYSPSYLPGYAASGSPATSTTHPISTRTAPSTAMITVSGTTSVGVPQQTGTTVTSTAEIKSTESSSELTISVTGTSTKSASTNGTTTSKSSSSSSATVSSAVGSSGVSHEVNLIEKGFVVAMAAGFAFLL